jgi:urease accessory protein
MNDQALYRLMTWMSPAYPVGGYSYSHGLEFAVEAHLVRDRNSLAGWIAALITHGAGQLDAVLFRAAYEAAAAYDDNAFAEVAELGAALLATAETALESTAQGAAFLSTTRTAWPDPALERLAVTWDGPIVYPVAVALACAARPPDERIPLAAALTAYLHAYAANFISAAVRLVPLGQTEGQLAIAALERATLDAVARALATPLDELGTATPMIDWASMQHETQYARLFRS